MEIDKDPSSIFPKQTQVNSENNSPIALHSKPKKILFKEYFKEFYENDLIPTTNYIEKYKGTIGGAIPYLPVYLDTTGISNYFKTWSSIESNIVVVTGEPGIGKTVSILAAASDNQEFIYSRFSSSFLYRLRIPHSQVEEAFKKGEINSNLLFPLMKLFGLKFILNAIQRTLKAFDKKSCRIVFERAECILDDREEYDGKEAEDLIKELSNNSNSGALLQEKIEFLAKKIEDFSKIQENKIILLHFDEIQTTWGVNQFVTVDRENPKEIEKYNLTFFADSMLHLKSNKNLKFALTGTAVGTKSAIDGKCESFSLICPKSKDILNSVTNLTDKEILRVSKDLEGSPRVVHYFVQGITRTGDFQESAKMAYSKWSNEALQISSRFRYALDEILFAILFYRIFGGVRIGGKSESIRFPRKEIPENWLTHVSSGIMKFEVTENDFYLYKPFHFMEMMMLESLRIFNFLPAEKLHEEINSVDVLDPKMLKRSFFKRAVALELSFGKSKLFQFIIDRINEHRSEKIIQNPKYLHTRIRLLTKDKHAWGENRLYFVENGLENGSENELGNESENDSENELENESEKDGNATGDLQLIESCQTLKGKKLNVIIQCNSEGISSFFKKCESRKEGDEIYISLNMETIQNEGVENDFCTKSDDRNTYVTIFGIPDNCSSLGIDKISCPKPISLKKFWGEYAELVKSVPVEDDY